MKTIKEWEESGMQLTSFLNVGDVVETAFADWALNIMPPAYWSERIIQVGEPSQPITRVLDSGTLAATAIVES
jgi:hypothetical protein